MITHWIERPKTEEEEAEFLLQRLYGREIYFCSDLIKKYEVLQKTQGVTRLKGTPTQAQLEIIIPELEHQYLFQKQVVEHHY